MKNFGYLTSFKTVKKKKKKKIVLNQSFTIEAQSETSWAPKWKFISQDAKIMPI
jgi:hypothetical protein